jgi:CRP-like cAMP-binding protein
MDQNLCALTEATVALIPHESIRQLTVAAPGIAAILWRDTLIDAAIFREWMVGLVRRSAFEHLAHLFCETYLRRRAVGLARDYRCSLPLTQIDLGDGLGLSNVHVNRVLMQMQGQGIATLRGSTLIIADWQMLVRAAGFDPTYLHLKPEHAAPER